MTRGYVIYGESLVTVKGGAHLSGFSLGSLTELGLTSDEIRIIPRYVHHNIRVDDFGPEIPPEVLANLIDCTVKMTLINYDADALNVCLQESYGGTRFANGDGTLAPAGTPMGGMNQPFASGCHYISMCILNAELPWRFPTSYLAETPVEIPIGTNTSCTSLTWKAIPYKPVQLTLTTIGELEPLGYKVGSAGYQRASQAIVTQGSYTIKGRGELISSGVVIWDHQVDT